MCPRAAPNRSPSHHPKYSRIVPTSRAPAVWASAGKCSRRSSLAASWNSGLVENHLRPQRTIQTLDRHRQQEIPLQARPEDSPGSLSTTRRRCQPTPRARRRSATASVRSTTPPPPPDRHRRRSAPPSAQAPRTGGPAAAAATRAHPAATADAGCQQPMPVADLLRRQLPHIDQPAHRRPAHPQQIRGLLRRRHRRPRRHRHRTTGPQRGHHLFERRMHLRRQLHLIMLTGTAQQNTAARPGHRGAARARRGSRPPPPTPHPPPSAGDTCADPTPAHP